jgi:ketosteroid isomerase-like protein
MNRRRMLSLGVMLSAVVASNAVAQRPADIEGVKAASQAFYTTLSVLDDGTAMGKVWAQRPYVTYVGPQGKSIIVGWDAQKKYWEDFNKRFSERSVSLVDAHIYANGNLAWEIGLETGQAHFKDGTTRKVDWFATNVYEKIDGRWLMVSHHVQPKPQ